MRLALSDIIPNPDTRLFIQAVFREWGVEWAAVLTQEISEGVLVDMGHEDFYPCPEHPGVNIANRPCYRCGHTKPENDRSWKYADRGWHEREETQETPYNPNQLNLKGEVQLSLGAK